MAQLEDTANFLLALACVFASGAALWFFLRGWQVAQIGRLALILFVAVLSFVTARTAFRANFILYDTAKEFLVYAHSARDPKDVLEQVEEISFRLTGGKDIVVAYDNDMLYPYWWYFRDYPTNAGFQITPPVICDTHHPGGSGNFG